MHTEPLHPDLGVRIADIDIKRVDDSEFDEIVGLYYRHSLIVVSAQQLAPADQARLAHRFGRPKIENRKQYNLREHPEVSTVGNVHDARGKALAFFNRGGVAWHTDGTAACHVNAATFLYAVEVPRRGGDTMWCSTAAAYDTLPGDLRKRIANMRILASFHAHNDAILEKDPASHVPLTEEERAALPPVWHDVVQTHPVTGRKVLYLYADPIEIDGVPAAQGHALIAELMAHCTQPPNVYKHAWQPGDLAVWDNHATLHSATDVAPYEADRRLMHRSFVYTLPTARPIPNLDELNAIFMP